MGPSLTNIEITDQNIKAFSAVAKKYDIDFALKKDPTSEIPRTTMVFFKGEGRRRSSQPAFKEFTAMTLGRRRSSPTIRERLAQAQEQAKRPDTGNGEKVKTKDREVAR